MLYYVLFEVITYKPVRTFVSEQADFQNTIIHCISFISSIYKQVIALARANQKPNSILCLKGVYEDYTRGYNRKPLEYPLPWVPISFSSVDPIFSNFALTILFRSGPYFSYFYACGKWTFKTATKTKNDALF